MTMLLDILSDPRHRCDDQRTKQNIEGWRSRFADQVNKLPRYRVSPEVIDMVYQLREELRVPFPGEHKSCWVEFTSFTGGPAQDWSLGKKPAVFGVLVDDNMKGLAFIHVPDTGIIIDFVINIDNVPVQRFKVQGPREFKNDHEVNRRVGQLYVYALKVLFLLNHPKIVEAAPSAPFDPKLQRARVKNGKHPFCDHHEVVIHVTRKEQEARARVAEYEARHGVRLHRVRAHVKVQNDRLIRIAEYWRGDAALGAVKTKSYKVTL